MASIQKYSTKKGTKWLYRVYIGIDDQTGKKKYVVKRGFENKKSATLACAKFEVQASNGGIKKQKDILFSEVYQEWYLNYKNTVRESTWNRTEGMFKKHILPYFGEKRIATITTHEIQGAVNAWYAHVTANYKRWYNYTVSVFDYAIKQEYVSRNPAKNIILPKKHDVAGDKLPNFWSKEQLNKFFSCIDPNKNLDIFTMFRVLAYVGCRRGELLALEWNDIDLAKQTIRINKTLTQGEGGKQIVQAPKTRNSRRTVPIDSKTNYWLRRWKMEQRRLYLILGFNTSQPHQLVFANTKNGYHSLNTPAKRLKKIISDNNLKPSITVHGFRHSHISALLSAGVPVTAVQLRVGHASPEVTLSVYSHITAKQSRNAAEKLESYLEN
ncbi:tyrosine-type recombinase/integrase [Liquorilactobacillus satsumensis]|uniref:site-specific integrase n=1 Tax=Liquorilactobacillus satsumensis TaxID=259059 RepID=UPI0039EC83B2